MFFFLLKKYIAPLPPPPTLNINNVGYFFESFEVQLITLCLIALDVATAVTNMLLDCGTTTSRLPILSKIIQSFSGFTIFFFLLELMALIFAFRLSFFTHAGNIIDTVVVATCLIWEVNGESRSIRLLSVLRGWRLLRLVSTMLTKKDLELDQCTEEWHRDQQLLEEAKLEIERLGDSIRREMESKKRVENMLKSYKDEVDTLNEALRIAALDIASTAGDQLLSDEEDAEGDESGTPQKKYLPALNRSSGSGGNTANSSSRLSKTLVISSDGSYSHS